MEMTWLLLFLRWRCCCLWLFESVELSSLQSFNKIKREEEQQLIALLCELWVWLEGYVRACLHTAKMHQADTPELKHPDVWLWPETPKGYLLAKQFAAGARGICQHASCSEWRAYIKEKQLELWHPQPGLMGTEPLAALRPWAKGSSCTSAAGGSCTEQIPSHCFVPSSHRCKWLRWDLELGPGGGGELLQRDEGQRGQQLQHSQAGNRSSARARWGHTSQNTTLGLVIPTPKHNTGSLTAVTTDSL